MALQDLNPMRCPLQTDLYYDINPAKDVYSDAGVTPCVDNDLVLQVNSQVGNGYFEAIWNEPTFKTGGRLGHPYLAFNTASDTGLFSDSAADMAEATIFTVIEFEGSFPSESLGVIGYDSKIFNLGLGGGAYRFMVNSLSNGTSALVSDTRPTYVDGTTLILSGRYGGSNSKITVWENYAKVGERDGLTTYPNTDGKLILGNWLYGSNTPTQDRFTGKMYRTLVFNRALSDEEHTQVTDYLSSLYGCTSVNSDFKSLEGPTQRGFVRNGYITSADCPTKTLIALFGQSNAVGWSTADYNTISDVNYKGDITNVQTFSDSGTGSFSQLNVPNNNGSSNDDHGVEPSLTYDVASSLGEEIYLLKYAEGGTSIADEWNVENEGYRYTQFARLYEKAAFTVGEMNGAKVNIYPVWIQGESDSNSQDEVLNYQSREADLYNALDAIHAFQKFISVKLYASSGSYPYVSTTFESDGINYSINLAKDRNATALAKYVTIEPVSTSGDGVHWTTAGYISQGQAAAAEILL